MLSVALPLLTLVMVTVTPAAPSLGLMVLGDTVKMPLSLDVTLTLSIRLAMFTCSVEVPVQTMSFCFTFSTTIGLPTINTGSLEVTGVVLLPLSELPESEPLSPESEPPLSVSVQALQPLLDPAVKLLSNEPQHDASENVCPALLPHRYSAKHG